MEETSDEEDFNKSVTERRQQIEKRLSVDRAIPASSQRVEIVQEISSIKEQGLVEDKIMEVEQKATPAPDSKAAGAPKTTLPSERAASDTGKAPSDEKTTTKVTTVISDSYTEIRPDTKERITHKMTETVTTDRRDSDLLEGVTHILESKKPVAKLIGTEGKISTDTLNGDLNLFLKLFRKLESSMISIYNDYLSYRLKLISLFPNYNVFSTKKYRKDLNKRIWKRIWKNYCFVCLSTIN